MYFSAIYFEGTCPRSLLCHFFETPVLVHWAHLGFGKKRPQCLLKRLSCKSQRLGRKTTKHVPQDGRKKEDTLL